MFWSRQARAARKARKALQKAETDLTVVIREFVSTRAINLVVGREHDLLKSAPTRETVKQMQQADPAIVEASVLRAAGIGTGTPQSSRAPNPTEEALLAKLKGDETFRENCVLLFAVQYLLGGRTETAKLQEARTFSVPGGKTVETVLEQLAGDPPPEVIAEFITSSVRQMREAIAADDVSGRRMMQETQQMAQGIAQTSALQSAAAAADAESEGYIQRKASDASEKNIRKLIEDFDGAYDYGDEASKALIRIGAPAVPFLLEALQVKDGDKCPWAQVTLRGIGWPREAIPILQHILKDPEISESRRKDATKSLQEAQSRNR